jgi:glycosyltransferase involved in cell wall biosynthesis
VDWDGPVSVLRVNNTFKDLHTFEWIYRNRGVHEGFLKSLESFQPDLVHIHHLTGLSSTIVEEVKLRKLPLVMTLHDFWMVCPRGQRMTADLTLCEDVDREKCFKCLGSLWHHFFRDRGSERTVVDVRGRLSPMNLAEWDRHVAYILNLCDVLIAPSEFHRERMLDFPIDPERIVALPHSLPWFPKNTAPRENRPLRRIGFLGSVIPVKGVHVLIQAFRRLSQPDLELHIHGAEFSLHGDRDYGVRLRELAEGDSRVRFHGGYGVEAVPKILEELDVMVVPSLWWESFCLTLREAQLAGVPVVASDLGAMREALDGEQDGLLFRVNDPEDLARVLTRLIEDDTLREKLSNRGGVVKDPEVHTQQVLDLYDLAAARAKQRASTLLVAPPTFPAIPEPPAPVVRPIPWSEVAFAVSQDGPAKVTVAAKMPNQHKPKLTLDVGLDDGELRVSKLRLEVDLSALDPNRPAKQPPKETTESVTHVEVKEERTLPELPTKPTDPVLPTRKPKVARNGSPAIPPSKPVIPEPELVASAPVTPVVPLASVVPTPELIVVPGTGPSSKLVKTKYEKAAGKVRYQIVPKTDHVQRKPVPPPKTRRVKPS